MVGMATTRYESPDQLTRVERCVVWGSAALDPRSFDVGCPGGEPEGGPTNPGELANENNDGRRETLFASADEFGLGIGVNLTAVDTPPTPILEVSAVHFADARSSAGGGEIAPPPHVEAPQLAGPTMSTAVCPHAPLRLGPSAKRVALRLADGRRKRLLRANVRLRRKCGRAVARRTVRVRSTLGDFYVSRFKGGYRVWRHVPPS